MTFDAQAISIRPAQTEELIELRHAILRTGLPRRMAYFEGDDEPTTRHVVAVLDKNVIGCATILHRAWRDEPAWQLRGMAVIDPMRGCGVGTKLLDEIESIVLRAPVHSMQLWCNARVPARKFYEQHGWVVESEEFVIEHAGPHVKMSKRLE